MKHAKISKLHFDFMNNIKKWNLNNYEIHIEEYLSLTILYYFYSDIPATDCEKILQSVASIIKQKKYMRNTCLSFL